MKYLRNVSFGRASMEKDIQTELSHIIQKIVNSNKTVIPKEIFAAAVMNVLWISVAGEIERWVRLKIFCTKINVPVFRFVLPIGKLLASIDPEHKSTNMIGYTLQNEVLIE